MASKSGLGPLPRRAGQRERAQRFGAHMSIAGGLHHAFDHGERAGCDCVQIFVKNQRQWRAAPMQEQQIREFLAARTRTGIDAVSAHATYLINVASPDSVLRGKSIDALTDELIRCEALGIPFLVFHPGAHMGEGDDVGIGRIAAALDEIHTRTEGFRSQLALECTAGQGSAIGWCMEHLGRIVADVRAPERLRVCLDTCHLFAAGYDLREGEAYERLVGEMKKQFGLKRLCCIHVNDSKTPCGKRVDRHEHIGRGQIGRKGFERILNDPRMAGLPKILETPKEKNKRGTDMDIVNLRLLRSWILA